MQLTRPRDHLDKARTEIGKDQSDDEWEKNTRDLIPMMEIHQYVDLFFEHGPEKFEDMDHMREEGWTSFYKGLIELFVIDPADFDSDLNLDAFLENFSTKTGPPVNESLKTVGDYNEINSHPIVQLDDGRYFVPVSFLVFEAVYETPFYWMMKDDAYRAHVGTHRGEIGEQLAYNFLHKVFGEGRVYKSVKVKTLLSESSTTRREDKTDIDVLCILGSKALCVQVKSKRLTELTRKGSDEALQRDFKAAVQDAYDQGIEARKQILSRDAKFLDQDGNEIILSEKIDEVYIMGLTTENYPSLTHQAGIMLRKDENDPFPIFLTLFDLDLVMHYLSDPYDFLYYVRQRTALMDYFKAEEEVVFLGYHLIRKLWKIPGSDMVALDNTYGTMIDGNYYPKKLGIDIQNDEDRIANRWKNPDFEELCRQIKNIDEPRITDVLFHLYDFSSDAIDALVKHIRETKSKDNFDEKRHNFSMPPDYKYRPRVGVTYVALNSNSPEKMRNMLVSLSQVRKYKSKGDFWIGFGSFKDSDQMIDAVYADNSTWVFDEAKEAFANSMLDGVGSGRLVRLGKKVGRNEKCPCGSQRKYKKCCGDDSLKS